MAKTSATINTAKKSNQSFKRLPKTPCFFISFLYFSYLCFSNSLTIEVKFHKLAKYLFSYNKMELLQPSGSLIENKINSKLRE